MLNRRSFIPITDWSASLLFAPVVLCAALLLAACESEPVDTVRAEAAPRPVRVAEARASTDATELRLPGALRAEQRARLAFLNDGYLAERPADPGDTARQGQTLAMLYNPALQPGVAAAQADVRQARTRLEQLEIDTRRQASLVERDLVSEDDLDQTRTRRDAARAALEQAQAELARARAQLDDAVLRAPFSGRVAQVFAEPGDFVRAGQPVLALAGDAPLEVEVQVRPDAAAALAVGGEAEVRMAESGRRLTARITEIGRAEPGRPVPVVVQTEADAGADLSAGAPVYVHVRIESPGGVAVPLTAVVDPGTGYARLFRVVDGRAEQVPVLPGRLSGGWVEVGGKIAAGDRIVVAGQAHLLDGESVRVLP